MKLTRRTLVLAGGDRAICRRGADAQSWPPGQHQNCRRLPAGRIDRRHHAAGSSRGCRTRLGTTIIIENRAGASGSVGTGRSRNHRPTAIPGSPCSTTTPPIHSYCPACPTIARRISTRFC